MTKLIRGRYEPLEVVGRGGQGEVLRALDRRHDRQVALKIRAVRSDGEREQLLQEARILLSLRPHPGLPLVRQDFFVGRRHFLVMDWVEGTTLARLLDERGDPGLPFSSVLGCLAQVAGALDHLHGHDPPVVHRDVKPANLILTPERQVVLVDFGIAQRGGEPGRPATGTRGYQAPELASGAAPTPAADVYSLAATAFALLTGAPPEGTRSGWEGVPVAGLGAIERAIRRGLSTHPARRPASAGEFVEQLRAWLEAALPAGTVTFLLTDIEGSSKLWDQHPEAMSEALARHDQLVTEAVERHGGRLPKAQGEGDSAFAVFVRAAEAVECALAFQRALAAEPWPEGASLRVRMALHTGQAEFRQGDYYGPAVNRCARLRALAHGGQTLLSQATAELVREALPEGATLRDLGTHRLKDLARPERVFQACHPDLPAEFPPLRSLEALSHNLPVQLTSFIGREREMAEVKRQLSAARLVTLTGAGGCGKTRLALQVAADLAEEYPDGVWLVELAPLREPGLVPQAVASALGVREEPGRGLTETLADRLGPRELLLLLDNCEHLVGACAELADALLRACAKLKILDTSREPLGVAGEVTWRVPSLSLPDPGHLPPLEALTQYEGVRLFVDRATLGKPDFKVTGGNALQVARISHRLDGIPLAIELAAARVKVLTVEQIDERLDDRFRLLTGGVRTALPRHQTLRAAVDWSYDLLSLQERLLFGRLSVFAGGFTLEAAERVCSGDGLDESEVLGLLSGLVDRSLAVAEERSGKARYSLLNTMRQYAREKLEESGQEALPRTRHLDWCVSLAERAEPELTGPDQAEWLDRLEAEHDNLRAALTWSVNRRAGVEAGLRLGGALWRFWWQRGYQSEGRGWLEQALSAPADGPPAARAKALRAAGVMAGDHADYAASRAFLEESLAIAREFRDAEGVALALGNLGVVARRQGDFAAARPLHEESLALHRQVGEKRGISLSLGNLGVVAMYQGDHEAARAHLEEGLTIDRELGDTFGIAGGLYRLGDLARTQGDYRRATALHHEALALFRELGNKEGVPSSLERLAGVAVAQDDCDRAARLFGAAEALRHAMSAPVPPSERADHEHGVSLARAGLGAEAFEAAWAEGRAMPLERAIEYALGEPEDA